MNRYSSKQYQDELLAFLRRERSWEMPRIEEAERREQRKATYIAFGLFMIIPAWILFLWWWLR